MATATPAATSTPAVAATTSGLSRARAAIIAAALSAGAVAVAVSVLWQPWGKRNQIGYADIAPHSDAAWLGTVVNGLGFATVGVTLGLAVCVLAPRRGSTWANIGAVVSGLGAVAFCAGLVAFGSFAWYATNVDAIPANAGSALMGYVESNPGHVLGLQIAGFMAATLGSMLLMVALWRARTVPRWLSLGYLVLTAGLFALRGDALSILQALQTLSLLTVAFFTLRAAGRPVRTTL